MAAQDVVDFSGKAGQYVIAASSNANTTSAFTVTDAGTGRTSVDHLSHVEFLQFSDQMTLAATSTQAEITLLYRAALGRTPDVAGEVGWQNAFATEPQSTQQGDVFTALAKTAVAGLPDLAYGFTHSVEFQQKYGALNNTQFVTQLYANVLDRAPDAGGLSYWVGFLNQGYTREWVLVGFAESAEAMHDATVGFVGQSGAHHAWLSIV